MDEKLSQEYLERAERMAQNAEALQRLLREGNAPQPWRAVLSIMGAVFIEVAGPVIIKEIEKHKAQEVRKN